MKFEATPSWERPLGDSIYCRLSRSCKHAQDGLCNILKCKSFTSKVEKKADGPFVDDKNDNRLDR